MCSLDHNIQTLALECPDSIAVLFEGDEDRQPTMFYALDTLVSKFTPVVVAGNDAAMADEDELSVAFHQGAISILLEILDLNDLLVGTSQLRNVNDIGDLFPGI